jgi:hypothetical protein
MMHGKTWLDTLYVFDAEGNPMKAGSLHAWSRFMAANRRVAETMVGDVRVRTVFLGIGTDRRPGLWQTMVFGGKLDETQERYCTGEEARAGHDRWLALVRETNPE